MARELWQAIRARPGMPRAMPGCMARFVRARPLAIASVLSNAVLTGAGHDIPANSALYHRVRLKTLLGIPYFSAFVVHVLPLSCEDTAKLRPSLKALDSTRKDMIPDRRTNLKSEK